MTNIKETKLAIPQNSWKKTGIVKISNIDKRNKLSPNELAGSVKEMLVLHKETTINDRRKRKDMEEVWANVVVRLLLLSEIYQWFNDDQQVVLSDEAFSNIDSPSATLFLGKKKQDLQIRPRRQGDQVFKIEN